MLNRMTAAISFRDGPGESRLGTIRLPYQIRPIGVATFRLGCSFRFSDRAVVTIHHSGWKKQHLSTSAFLLERSASGFALFLVAGFARSTRSGVVIGRGYSLFMIYGRTKESSRFFS